MFILILLPVRDDGACQVDSKFHSVYINTFADSNIVIRLSILKIPILFILILNSPSILKRRFKNSKFHSVYINTAILILSYIFGTSQNSILFILIRIKVAIPNY